MEPSSEASRPALQEQDQQQQDQQQSQQQHPDHRRIPTSPMEPGAADDETDPEAATTHLARFEFSSDGGGTKVLMVEWQPRAAGAAAAAAATPSATTTSSGAASVAEPEGWDIAWPGKSTNLPANDSEQNGSRRRVFFLLPPNASVPATVTITPTSKSATNAAAAAAPHASSSPAGRLEVKPLPAIFPAGFDHETGTRGVLHTLWAKRRIAELGREMDAEMRTNAESVGLEMALAEKQWIEDNFLAKPLKTQTITVPVGGAGGPGIDSLVTPISPRSPGGRLGEKLKGLKLATTPADLVPSPTANTFTRPGRAREHGNDVAVSSMSAISQSNHAHETASLDAAIKGQTSSSSAAAGAPKPSSGPRDEEDEELFALPMSPRSPDMKKSPFSMLK